MMKFTKRLLCVLLTVVMVMTLCACGSLLGKPTLVGEWETYLDLTDYMNEMLDDYIGMGDMISDFSFRMIMEFEKDGTVSLYIDEDYLEDVMEDFADEFWGALVDEYAGQMGMTASEVEDILEQSGVSKDTLIEEMDMESMLDSFDDVEGYWLLEDNLLYIAEDQEDLEDADPVEIEFDGRKSFSMLGGDGLTDGLDEDLIKELLPLVFNRI